MQYSEVLLARSCATVLLICCGLAIAEVHHAAADAVRATDASNPQAALVQMNVVAQKPPEHAGLAPNDFHIEDNGKPQSIVSASPAQVAVTCEAPAGWPAGGRGTHTNCIEQRAGTANKLILILIDWPRIQWIDHWRVRKGIVEMLEDVRPGDRIGVYSLSSGTLRVLHDCTLDASVLPERASEILRSKTELLTPVKLVPVPFPKGKDTRGTSTGRSGYSAASGGPPAARGGSQVGVTKTLATTPDAATRAFEDALGDKNAPSFRCFTRGCVIEGSRALNFIADHLAQFRGRKNVIWISGQFPLGEVLSRMLKSREFPPPEGALGFAEYRVLRTLGGGNFAIYPVDATQVVSESRLEDFSSDPLDGPHAPQMRTDYRSTQSFAPLKKLAEFTSGRAYHNTGNFRGIMRDVIDDADTTYTLCYDPGGQRFDGRLHEVQVRLDRSHGKIRHPAGYFDLPKHPANETARDLELQEACSNPLDVSELKLFVQVLPHLRAANSMEVHIQVEPRDDDGRPNCEHCGRKFDVTFVEKGGGQRSQVCEQSVAGDPNRTPAETSEPNRGGVILRRVVNCSADAVRMRVVVRDAESGALGSVTFPLAATQD
jgi:VWFA-related protein